MLQAWQLMLAAVVITVITGFLISLMIQVLCRLVRLRPQRQSPDAEELALVIALALAGRKK